MREDFGMARELLGRGGQEEAAPHEDALQCVEATGRIADFHKLRHTFGTNLARAGVPPSVAMKLMRHSDITLTMKLYTHTATTSKADDRGSLPTIKPLALNAVRATGTGCGICSPMSSPFRAGQGGDWWGRPGRSAEEGKQPKTRRKRPERPDLAWFDREEKWHPLGDSNPCLRNESPVS